MVAPGTDEVEMVGAGLTVTVTEEDVVEVLEVVVVVEVNKR